MKSAIDLKALKDDNRDPCLKERSSSIDNIMEQLNNLKAENDKLSKKKKL